MSSPGRTSIKAKAKAAMKDKEAPPERIPILRDDSLEAVADYIKQGKAKNVIIMAGAGISTAAGIKDFRSPGTGLYSDLAKYNLPYPEAVFDIDFFKETPAPFYRLAKELYPGRYHPTLTHYFFHLLAKKNLLLRIYTQNIDSLERQAGIDGSMLVEAHGSFATSKCIQCGIDNIDNFYVKKHILKSEIPYCKRCGGLVKPAITFFGEDLPARFGMYRQDFPKCDLLIVLGTSLKVEPFNRLTAKVKDNVPRLLINREKAGEDVYGGFDFAGKWSKKYQRDAFFSGDCDSGVRELAKLLDWEADLDALYEQGHALLKIVEEKEALELQAEGQGVFQDEDDETDEDKDEYASQDPIVGKPEAELPVSADSPTTEKVAEAIDLIVSQLQQSSLAHQQSDQGTEEPHKDRASDQSPVAQAEPASEPAEKEDSKDAAVPAAAAADQAVEPALEAPKEEAKGSCGTAGPKPAVENVNALLPSSPPSVPIPPPTSESSSLCAATVALASSPTSFAPAYTPIHLGSKASPSFQSARRVSCPPPPTSFSLSSRHPSLSFRSNKSPRPQSTLFFASPRSHLPAPDTPTSSTTTTTTTKPAESPIEPLLIPSTTCFVPSSAEASDAIPPPPPSQCLDSSLTHITGLAKVKEEEEEEEERGANKKVDNAKPTTKERAGNPRHEVAEATTPSAWPATTSPKTTTTKAGTRPRTVSIPLTMRLAPSVQSPPGSTCSSFSKTMLPSTTAPVSSCSSSPSLTSSPLVFSSSPLTDATNIVANQSVAYPSPSPSPKLPPRWTGGGGGVSPSLTTMPIFRNQPQAESRHRRLIASEVESMTQAQGLMPSKESKKESMEEEASTLHQPQHHHHHHHHHWENKEKETHEEKEKQPRHVVGMTTTTTTPATTMHSWAHWTATTTTAPTVTPMASIHSIEPTRPFLFLAPSTAPPTKGDKNLWGASASGDENKEGQQHQQPQQQPPPRESLGKTEVHKKRLRVHGSESDLLERPRGALSTPDGSLHHRHHRRGAGAGAGLVRHGSLSSSSSASSACGPSLRRWTSAFPYLAGGPAQKKRRV